MKYTLHCVHPHPHCQAAARMNKALWWVQPGYRTSPYLTISVLRKQQGSAYCTCSGFCAVCVPHIISPSQETPSAAQNFAFHCTMHSQMFSNVQFNIHHTNTAGCSLGAHFKARKFIQHMRSKCANCSGMLMALRRTEDPETIRYI